MTCCVSTCNAKRKNEPGVTFHRFPANKDKKDAWLNALGMKNWSPANSTRICSKHFKESDFDRNSIFRTFLKDDAIPVIPDELRMKSRKRNEGSQDSSDAAGREVKRSRKSNPLPRKFDKSSRAKYDNRGYEKDTGLDLCDCLIEDCPGCWTDCPKCGSRKCGHECRVYRRYKYDYIEIEGANMTIKYNGK